MNIIALLSLNLKPNDALRDLDIYIKIHNNSYYMYGKNITGLFFSPTYLRLLNEIVISPHTMSYTRHVEEVIQLTMK
jgi:hypothetical protein